MISCIPFPCGTNALCNNRICTYIQGYQEDPYTGCRPKCVNNNACSLSYLALGISVKKLVLEHAVRIPFVMCTIIFLCVVAEKYIYAM